MPPLNGKLPAAVVSAIGVLAVAGVLGGVTTWSRVNAMEDDVEQTKADHDAIIRIEGKVQMVEENIERNREDNKEAHKAIMDKLDEIQNDQDPD